MALMIAVEDTTKSRKAEQAKIHDSIQLCKEILNIKTSQPRLPGLESAHNPPTDTSPVEKEEIDLLEKALENALRVRSGLEPSLARPNTVKPPGNQNVQGATCTVTKEASRASKEHTKNKLLFKTNKQKEQRKYQTTIYHPPCSKPADGFRSEQTKKNQIKSLISNNSVLTHANVTSKKLQTLSGHGTLDHGQNTLPCGPKNQMKSGQLSGKSLQASSVSKTKESGGNCLLQQNEILSEEVSIWTNLKSREHRLWDKILAFETKSLISGRDQFMERMKATFPMRWPCSSPEKTRALFNRLTQQGEDLTENRQIKDLMARQTPEEDTEMGGVGNIHDSSLKCKRPKMTAKDIHKLAVQVKREWESWDRWRPEWGCLCPTGADSEWQKGITASLPMTVTYTTGRDLSELEKLRMRVALLHQEAFLEKALSDTLSPCLSAVVHGPLNPSLLRDLYSVLGEGGERFPAIVLDSEPDS